MVRVYVSFIIFLFFLNQSVLAQPKYEFRGVWIATVDNIDWPSNKFLNTDSQKAEFTNLLDMHKRNGMNAVIAQIRPAADAFYPSQYEPWSEWLTGTQGKPPNTYYDPLEFMISETHKRGMEFHAWMNPYRAQFNIGTSSISPIHITRLHPEWFLTYGDKKYFDPGNKEAQQFVNNIVRDVVSRYDVDAIHFDDYFYPYRIAGKEFPDAASFLKYGNGMSKDDWRRSNVDSIIVLLGNTIKQQNKYCKFGVSPFGVWRNSDKDAEGSNTMAGVTNYDDLYADILLWLKMKWIDYVAPQLYWEFGRKLVPFETLIDWWAQHSYETHLYIGQGVYRAFEAKSPAWKNKNELPNQIKKLRSYPQVQGSIYFSSKTFNRNPNGWNDSLQNTYYKYPALVPPMPWINNVKPVTPAIAFDITVGNIFSDSVKIFINTDSISSVNVNKYVVYSFPNIQQVDITKAQNIVSIISAEKNYFPYHLLNIPPDQNRIIIGITSVNKYNNESNLSRIITLDRKENAWSVITGAVK
jgi:uncharacterized lipoprotein YddW (UPF0748 family)